ncbi:SYN8 Syntaxin-8 [Candida maltosa Xu316]|uniref:t-SNARE coiled-coil homology domain-containing protein n=1 Tax=Candida maltosa (strain Xu316) TaxID=1245528 RepID=M3HMG8_CANMX|nr:hypothetical protein G210_0791 [Candida maltosa Xu316]
MTINDTRLTISKIQSNIEELNNLYDERKYIYDLKLTPSKNENLELISLIQKTIQYFKFLESDINSDKSLLKDEELIREFEDSVDQYNQLYDNLSDDANIDITEYKYSYQRPVHTDSAINVNNNVHKSVRFKDAPDENDASELMGTRHNFKPYKDDPESIDDDEDDSPDEVSNHQMFAQHQQTMMRQDQDLENLHSSISRQYMMGQDINQELDDHLIILNDLEQGVDQSMSRLNVANRRIKNFRNLMRENGSLVTICTLTVILILLLVVLN